METSNQLHYLGIGNHINVCFTSASGSKDYEKYDEELYRLKVGDDDFSNIAISQNLKW